MCVPADCIFLHLCMVLPTICAERFWLQVIRGGGIARVSIYDIVVGDIVPLKYGGQVSITLLIVILVCLFILSFTIGLKYMMVATGTCRWSLICCKLIED